MANEIINNFESKNYRDLQKRLLRAMKNKNYTARKLAERISELNLIPSQTIESTYKSIKDYLKYEPDDKYIHFNPKSKETITNSIDYNLSFRTEFIFAFAKALNVSADYLLGLSDTMSTDINIREFCSKSYISEKSISSFNNYLSMVLKFKSYNNSDFDEIDILNIMLQDKNFYEYLSSYIDFAKLKKNDSISNIVSVKDMIGATKYKEASDLYFKLCHPEDFGTISVNEEMKKYIQMIVEEENEIDKEYEEDQKKEFLLKACMFNINQAAISLEKNILSNIEKEAKD